MKDIEFTVADIKDLMNTFSKNKLGSLSIEQGSFTLKLEGCKAEQAYITTSPPPIIMPLSDTSDAPEEPVIRGNIVKSPIVGTFYASPSPDKKPYVKVGSKVKKGDVLFIIESMKLMNEVTSDFDGTIGEILVENAVAVEYGQPILTIE